MSHRAFAIGLLCLFGLKAAEMPANPGVNGAVGIGAAVIDAEGRASVDIQYVSGHWQAAALQLDIVYPGHTVELLVSPGDAINSSEKSISAAEPQPFVRRVIIVGMNRNPIPSGVLATLKFQFRPEILPGQFPIELKNVMGSTSEGAGILPQVINGDVTMPGPDVRSVANAASYAATTVSPGEIIVVGGRTLAGPTTIPMRIDTGLAATSLDGARVLFGEIAAPLVYATENAISAVAPYALAGQSATSLRVEYQGVLSAPFALGVAESCPGIFTLDASGKGQGAIVNENGVVNGPDNPAPRRSIISIYGTGEGQTMPLGVDGSIVDRSALRNPVLPVKVSIGGQEAEVLYAGSVANQISGFLQVNARIPDASPSGSAVPVTLTIGGRSSQTGVTMAIQ